MANAVFSVFNKPLFAIDRIRCYWPRPELTETVRALREGFSGRTLRRPVLLQFFDEAISGSELSRPDLDRMLDYLVRSKRQGYVLMRHIGPVPKLPPPDELQAQFERLGALKP